MAVYAIVSPIIVILLHSAFFSKNFKKVQKHAVNVFVMWPRNVKMLLRLGFRQDHKNDTTGYLLATICYVSLNEKIKRPYCPLIVVIKTNY